MENVAGLKTLNVKDIPERECSILMSIEDALRLVQSPDSGEALEYTPLNQALISKTNEYPIAGGKVPILYHPRLIPYIKDGMIRIPFEYSQTPFMQYFLINYIKQDQKSPNSEHSDPWYLNYIYNARNFLESAKGQTLDVGCDTPSISHRMFGPGVHYLGLDVFHSSTSEFKLAGMAEFLPIKNESLDNVCFLTSLDHILDYRRALSEAYRVLKPGGHIYISSLIWYSDSDLFNDVNHFHHFTEASLLSSLSQFNLRKFEKFNWKNHSHREGAFLAARKE